MKGGKSKRQTRFIFIRHAESRANELGVVQGRGEDMPLSERGKKQAALLAAALKDWRFDRLFSSTAFRARETAAPIRMGRADVPYEELSVLCERSKGAAEGMLRTEFEKRYPHIVEAWIREEDPRPEGGESLGDVAARVMPELLRHVEESSGGETYGYMVHGNVMAAIVGAMLHMEPAKFSRIKHENCGITSVVFDHDRGRWTIEYTNRRVIPAAC